MIRLLNYMEENGTTIISQYAILDIAEEHHVTYPNLGTWLDSIPEYVGPKRIINTKRRAITQVVNTIGLPVYRNGRGGKSTKTTWTFEKHIPNQKIMFVEQPTKQKLS